MVEIANAGTLREIKLRIRTIRLQKQRRGCLYDTDVAIPTCLKNLITRQCTTICMENQVQEQSTSAFTTDAYKQASSLLPRLTTIHFKCAILEIVAILLEGQVISVHSSCIRTSETYLN